MAGAPMPTFPGAVPSGFQPYSSSFLPSSSPGSQGLMFHPMASTSGLPPHAFPSQSAPHMVLPSRGGYLPSGNLGQRTDTLDSISGGAQQQPWPRGNEVTADVREKMAEVPDAHVVENIMEVPQKILQERIVRVPKVEVVERKVAVPKPIYMEKVVEIPQVQYRDVAVERVVEVPEVQTQVVTREVGVPFSVEVPVTQPRRANVEQDIQRNIPTPVEIHVAQGYEIPRLKPKYKEVPVPIYVPRYIEVPVPAQFVNSIPGQQQMSGSRQPSQASHPRAVLQGEAYPAGGFMTEGGPASVHQTMQQLPSRHASAPVGTRQPPVIPSRQVTGSPLVVN